MCTSVCGGQAVISYRPLSLSSFSETGSHMHLVWRLLIQFHWTGSHKAQGPHLSLSSILFQVHADRPGFYGDARHPNLGLHDYTTRTLATEPSPEPLKLLFHERGSHYIAQAGLQLMTFLPLPPKRANTGVNHYAGKTL